MKLYKSILSAATISLGLCTASCSSEWLDITNNTQDPVEDYFSTEANIQQAVVAAYDPLHWFDYANNYTGLNIYPEVLADQCFPGGGDVNDMNQWKVLFNFSATANQVMIDNYSNAYSGVKRCNDAIKYMTDYWKPETQKELDNREYYKAQVLALRVFFYNQLWKWWGNIAYYTENLSGDFLAPQYTATEVYEAMIADLEEVIAGNHLP
ncbi:MAG: RagB/SusD family nutrient uptake outer membrane protein, partial [Muribaculaceae bacterium]|nr:RagB/SusD family nutrient uptake outer membrane protein [Muribaculaceae bacterium]